VGSVPRTFILVAFSLKGEWVESGTVV